MPPVVNSPGTTDPPSTEEILENSRVDLSKATFSGGLLCNSFSRFALPIVGGMAGSATAGPIGGVVAMTGTEAALEQYCDGKLDPTKLAGTAIAGAALGVAGALAEAPAAAAASSIIARTGNSALGKFAERAIVDGAKSIALDTSLQGVAIAKGEQDSFSAKELAAVTATGIFIGAGSAYLTASNQKQAGGLAELLGGQTAKSDEAGITSTVASATQDKPAVA